MTRYATIHVREGLKRRLDDMQQARANPVAWDKVQNKHAFETERDKTQKQLESLTPPDTTGAEKDHLRTRISGLQDAMTKGGVEVPPMPSYRQMQEDDTGDVGQHMAFERYWSDHTLDGNGKPVRTKRGEGALFEVKDLMRTLRKDEEVDNPDVANNEQFRPRDSQKSLITARSVTYAPTPAMRENFDQVFPDHEKTAVEKRIAREAKRREASERMKARWAAKKAAAAPQEAANNQG